MRLFGLIGHSLSHSFSRDFFEKKFREMGVSDCRFENFELDEIQKFPLLLKSRPELAGVNVTIPYKESVISMLDDMDPVAEEIGAVNTIRIDKDKRTTGFNTDHIGFRNSLTSFINREPVKAIILGTGGASKAIAFTLRSLGISYLFVSREPVAAESIGYKELNPKIFQNYKLIINCTPLGMYPEIEHTPPIPFELLTQDHYVFDLIYNPKETRLLELAGKAGAKTKNGYEMLILQAQASWDIWNSN